MGLYGLLGYPVEIIHEMSILIVVSCGYREKFGLYYVNYSDPTRPRVPKDSSHVMAEIIRTRHLPRQKYIEESNLEADPQHSRLQQNLQDRSLGSERQKIDDSLEQQNMERGGIEPNTIKYSKETAEELETNKEILSAVGINVN
jgi:hypothetical protein